MNNIILQGLLTSRIETRQDKVSTETYHYGFFQIPQQDQEIPVVFKGEKPNLPKGSLVELTGQWATSPGDRPSFTCSQYQVLKTPFSDKPRITELNIYQKLHLIQNQTEKIAKSELNKFQNYKYFTEQQALNILKPLLKEHKLTLTFSDTLSEVATEKTEKEWMVRYGKQAILTNSENPKEQLTFYLLAIGGNPDPAKAKGCAETYAIKYFLTKFFLIPTTDELDPDVTKDTEHLNRLKNGKQETAEQIQKRHEEKDRKFIVELKAKYGLDWKLSNEYKQWKGNL